MPRSKEKGRRSQRNRKPTRLAKPVILVVCEGGKTEPEYLKGLGREKRAPTKLLNIIPSNRCKGTDPLSLVNCAIEEKSRIEQTFMPVDQVWCVFDRDEHHHTNEAIEIAKNNGFETALSNPCFELWILLHFQKQTGHIERQGCSSLLKHAGHIPNFKKNMPGLCELLAPHRSTAIGNARALRKSHENYSKPIDSNPSTTVDHLVEAILKAY